MDGEIILPVHAFAFWDSGYVARLLDSEDWGKIIIEYLSLLHIAADQVSHFLLDGAHNFFNLPFITDVPELCLSIALLAYCL